MAKEEVDPRLARLRRRVAGHFEEAALSAFAYLSRYGFRHGGSKYLMPELYIDFRNATTDVTLGYELGSAPFVELGRLGRITGEELAEESYSIGLLLAERAPQEEWEFRCGLDDPGLPVAIERLASLVEKYAKDILEGDFSVFPCLQLRWFHDFATYQLRFLYGNDFVYFKTDCHPPCIGVRFRSENVEVMLSYKIGSHPWIEISRLAPIDGRKKKAESFDFELLLKERAPHEEYEVRFDLLDGGMRYGVMRLARLLEQYGQDVLEGDFSALMRFKESHPEKTGEAKEK